MATQKETELQSIIEKLEAEIKLKEKSGNFNAKELADLQTKKIELQNILDLAKQAEAVRIREMKSLEEEIKILEKSAAEESDSVKRAHILVDLGSKKLQHTELSLEHAKKTAELDKEAIKKLEKQVEEQQKTLNSAKEINIQENSRVKTLDKLVEKTNLLTGGYSTQITDLLTLRGWLSAIGQVFKEIVETNENLVKVTGQANSAARDMLASNTEGMARFGVGYKEMGESFNSLYAGMSSFSSLNKTVQADLTQNAAKMSNLGVSTETTAKNFELLNKGLRFSTDEVIKVNDKIAKAAIGAGITPQKALSELSSAMPQLSANGKKAVDVFIELQKQSKALGVEMSSLLGIVGEGFDTFEGAADKAGSLNAILGGDYLNSVEMLNATESERVEMLKRSFEQSGKNWDSLDRFEKKSIAASIGIKDMNEAAKIFGSTSFEQRKQLEAQAATQEQLTKAQELSAKTTDQLRLIMSSLIQIIAPFANIFKEIVVRMAEFPRTSLVVIGVVGLLYNAVNPFSLLLSKLGSLFRKAGKDAAEGSDDMSKAGPKIGETIKSIGEAAKGSWKEILAFGAAMLMIGGGVAIAALGLSKLVEAFKGLTGGQIAGAIAGLAVVMLGFVGLLYVLTTAATVAAVPLLGVGAAFLMIGAGIGLAALGLAQLVKAFGELKPEQILLIGAGMTIIAYSSLMAGAGLAVFAASLAAITLFGLPAKGVLWLLKGSIEDIGEYSKNAGEGMVNFVNSIKTITGDSFSSAGLKNIKEMLQQISDIIDNMPNELLIVAKAMSIRTLTETLNSAANVSTKITPAKDFVVAAKDFYVAQKDSKSADNDALIAALKAAMPSGKETGNTGIKAGTPVILKIENGPDLRAYVLGAKASIF